MNLVIVGAAGRMGRSLLGLLPQFPALRLHAAVVAPGSPALGRDSGAGAGLEPNGVAYGSSLEAALAGADLVFDFSVASAAPAHLHACLEAGVPLLLGTTGLGAGMPELLRSAAQRIPLLCTANTSLGIALLEGFAATAARVLGSGFDVQIVDLHHRDKRDAPSGTALALGAAVEAGAGAGRRVGYASLRGGDAAGEHEIRFLGPGEQLGLRHVATDRAIFARGALVAGSWLVGRPAGAYRMADVFREK